MFVGMILSSMVVVCVGLILIRWIRCLLSVWFLIWLWFSR